ncbi:MAG: Release factor glutamine methyltransferase [Candidatus Parcubacteria bacterium]|jgi:release factor glutamine methyltransferase
MNIKEITQQIKQRLKSKSPTPDLDTYLILSNVLKKSRLDLILSQEQNISSSDLDRIEKYVQQRLNYVPIAYIIGNKEFYGREFITTPDVLIPRPETESIIDIAKEHILNDMSRSIWEIGTGSGCIAITLAAELQNLQIIASDISHKALQVAKNNAIILLGVNHNITWLEGDLLTPFSNIKSEPNLLIANLPYLDPNKYQDDSISLEPDLALYSNNNGLEHYMRLISEINSRFIVMPKIIIEINPEQLDILIEYLSKYFLKYEVKIFKDLQGLDRHLLITPV